MAFMKRFWGAGDKYARDIWMSTYDPDFCDAIAVDDRIKRVTRAMGYSFKTYEEHERFYQGIAAEAGLEPWEVDRLLYNYQKEFLDTIGSSEEVSTETENGFWADIMPLTCSQIHLKDLEQDLPGHRLRADLRRG